MTHSFPNADRTGVTEQAGVLPIRQVCCAPMR